MPEIEVIFYEKSDGTVPVKEFLASLDAKMRAKLARIIDRLKARGYELREPYSKPLGDGVFELRSQVAKDSACVLYFFVVNGRAVLTHGFIKKTQKTPQEEIDNAKHYRADYLSREA